jgi:hypothetical protein
MLHTTAMMAQRMIFLMIVDDLPNIADGWMIQLTGTDLKISREQRRISLTNPRAIRR